jgi:hypothetical protein
MLHEVNYRAVELIDCIVCVTAAWNQSRHGLPHPTSTAVPLHLPTSSTVKHNKQRIGVLVDTTPPETLNTR